MYFCKWQMNIPNTWLIVGKNGTKNMKRLEEIYQINSLILNLLQWDWTLITGSHVVPKREEKYTAIYKCEENAKQESVSKGRKRGLNDHWMRILNPKKWKWMIG